MAHLLVVEDDTTFSLMLESFLQKKGHQADLRNDVKSGIRAVKEKAYDMLLLDYRLPDGNGLQVLEASRESGQQLPAVIMTTFNDVRTAVRAIRSGALDYITKPVNPDELLMVLNEALQRKTVKPDKAAEPLPDFIEGTSTAYKKLHDYI